MKDLKDKFKRAGGAQILRQYLQSHVLGYALMQAALQGTSQKSLEIVRLSVNNKMLGKLRKKNRAYIEEYLEKERAETGKAKREQVRGKEIWMLWLDGEDKAPEIVQKCIASVRNAFPDRTVHVLTEDTYREYAKFPAFIQEKIDSGQITKTHMSDLLRLELLIRYGGTWIDATVLEKPRPICWTATSSSSRISNPDGTAMSRGSRAGFSRRARSIRSCGLQGRFCTTIGTGAAPHILLLRLFEPYDPEVMDAVKEMTPFHKLTYKFEPEKKEIPGTYYKALLEGQPAREEE